MTTSKPKHGDLLAWLEKEKPPETFPVDVSYGPGMKATDTFIFTRSLAAYDRFMQTIMMDKKPLKAASQFLIDTVAEESRGALANILERFPNNTIEFADQIMDRAYGGALEVTLKNVPTPAAKQ